MKPSLVFPLLTALVGFGLGWLAKPAAPPAMPSPPLAAPIAPQAPPLPPPAALPPRDPTAISVRKTAPATPAAAATAAERREKITEGKNAAKMLRLTEALSLSDAQQTDLQKIITASQQAALASHAAPGTGPTTVLDRFAASGAAMEKSLADLLTPEQRSAFADLRKRERDNRIETTAQRELGNLTEVTDLSAAQREQVLAQLRQATAAELDAVPEALGLIVDSSILPLGPFAPSAQSIQTLRQLAASHNPDSASDLPATLIDSKRRQLDERLNRLKDILTPAQLAQYRASISEQQAIHDLMIPPPR